MTSDLDINEMLRPDGIVPIDGATTQALVNECLRLRSLLKEAVTWQPIETAPKDGTPILTYRDGEEDSFEINEWFEFWRDVYDEQENGLFTKRRELCTSGWSQNAHRATHWMPLPPPPSSKEGE